MEVIWYVLAALGAGIGTGLAGLSAATVMVPILIVLCPSFSGETGAYQATAIALASDILASAVTAATYMRNGNIDLRRGKVMLVCVLSMCVVGSYAAWLAGGMVLGGFTLFLTFCIGIRFLVKPDSPPRKASERGQELDVRGIVISLFFGLTIGFGAGFVGTGGGMMMLVVFTVFLGMELKEAVGTSTFIMTFTALIASVSHMIIHPAILFERGDVMLICIVVATVASLFSARFANRVPARTVGLATGAVLTVLGASMILLRYGSVLAQNELAVQVLQCLGRLVLYLVPCVTVLLLLFVFVHVPSLVFRKLLHVVAFTCITLMIVTSPTWQAASLASCVVAVVVYPILSALEGQPWYAKLFVQKSPGEIKRSLLMLFFMFATLVAVGWGVFDKRELVAAAILMWGPGDAVAALAGTKFGAHKVTWGFAGGKKSWEGSVAMLLVAMICGAAVLLASGYAPGCAVLLAVAGGLVGTLVELITPSEYDTVTVPAAILAVLLV